MGLPPQNFAVGVAARMRNDTGSEKDGSKSLGEMNHDDCKFWMDAACFEVAGSAIATVLLYLWPAAR
jgi:hypothetical protein